MDAADVELRNVTYGLIAPLGRVPTRDEVAAAAGIDVTVVGDAWRRLHDAHALVLDAATGEVRMANPFAGVATPFRVQAGGRDWFANCAWDAFGICAALERDGDIVTVCADCSGPLSCAVRARQPSTPDLLFHCLVPAAAWWDDIVFT